MIFNWLNGRTFLYRRVNSVFNATIWWYYCSDVLCFCCFYTYTENFPFLQWCTMGSYNFWIILYAWNQSFCCFQTYIEISLSYTRMNYFISLKPRFFLALYTAPLWVSFGMTLGLLEFGMNLGQIRTFLVK